MATLFTLCLSTFILLVNALSGVDFSIDSGCSMMEPDSTAMCPDTDRFSCTVLADNKCGCNQPSIISNVIFVIDNTGFTNNYSWFYWSTEWIKIYQNKILIHQPSIAPYVRYVHIGSNSAQYIITPNIDINGSTINPYHIFNSWTIPSSYKNTDTPDFCASIHAAVDSVTGNANEDKNIIIVYLANSTPYYANDTVCANIASSNQSISIYTIRSSPNVDMDHIANHFSNDIKLQATLIDEYEVNITDHWGSKLNETSNVMLPNYKLVDEYMNDIVATASDFICNASYLCDSTTYKSSNNSNECQILCESMDRSCINDTEASSKYYIMKRSTGMKASDMMQSEANHRCNEYFGSSLASLKTSYDIEIVTTLMNDLDVDECWIGINDTNPVFMDLNGSALYQWMDGNINSFHGLSLEEDNNASVHCVSISDSGETSINDCEQEQLSCAICNVIDDPMIMMQDDRNYLVFTESDEKTWQQADDFCVKHFGTHLSTVQSAVDETSVINNAKQVSRALQKIVNISVFNNGDDFEIWIGSKILISYDECIDYWTRKFNIIHADGSHFNYTLINLIDIIIETCAPTAAPTFSPTQAPTDAPSFSPTDAPTKTPTAAPTDSPTRSPTDAPTQSPTKSPTDTTNSPTESDISFDIPISKGYYNPPSNVIIAPQVTMSIDPFLTTKPPTNAPKRSMENPLEPSLAPTRSPTPSPVYLADECVVLLAQRIKANHTLIESEYEYEYKWRSIDCDASYLSMFSCNQYDRASYQALDSSYFLLIDDDGKTWNEANEYCQNIFGTSLATIYDPLDQSEIIDLKDKLVESNDITFADQQTDDIWIGMRLDDGNFGSSQVSWSDHSTSNYSNLISGCLAMDNNNASLWNIELCEGNNINHIWSCNNFVPTQRPTVAPTLLKVVAPETTSMFQLIADFITGHPFEIIYCTILLISIIVTLLAWIHAKSGTCCWGKCDCLGYSENAKYIAALIFGLQLWDFLSDVSFAYNLPNKQSSTIFYLSAIFIVVPWMINIIFLLLFRFRWANNREVASWLREHTYKLVGMTMVCGGAQPSIELANSRIFGLELFSMGLSRYQLIQTSKFKVLLTTMLENIPQIFITTYYMVSIHEWNDFAVASLISSSCSVILVIVATILMRADNLVDEPMEIALFYRFATKNKKQRNKLARIGLHSSIAKEVANAIEVNENMVFVDKHSLSLKSVTFNVSVTNVRSKEEMEEEMHRMEEGEEDGLVSKTSTLYGLNERECKQIVEGVLNVLKMTTNEIRISKMEIWPLDYNGARGYVPKVTTFDRNHRVHATKWEFPDNPLIANYHVLHSGIGDDGDHKTTDEDVKEEEERVGLLVEGD